MDSGKKSGRVYCRFAIVSTPFIHIAIVYSDFVSVSHLILLGFLLYTAVRCTVSGRFSGIWKYQICLLLFVVWLGITLIWAVEWRESIKQYLEILLVMGFILALHQGKYGAWQVATAKRDLVFVGAAVALLGILQITFGERFYPAYYMQFGKETPMVSEDAISNLQAGLRSIRGTGTFNNANAFGIFLLLPFFLALDELLRSRKPIFLVSFVLIIGGIISTFSRGAYTFTLLGAYMLVSYYIKRRRLPNMIIIATIGFGVILYFSSEYAMVLSNMFGGDSEDSLRTNIRYDYWIFAIRDFWTTPVFGQGYASVGFNQETRFVGFDPHSSYLFILLNQGGIGISLLVLFLWKVYTCFRSIMKSGDNTMYPVFVAFTMYLISLMVDGLFNSESLIYLAPVALLAMKTGGMGLREYNNHMARTMA